MEVCVLGGGCLIGRLVEKDEARRLMGRWERMGEEGSIEGCKARQEALGAC